MLNVRFTFTIRGRKYTINRDNCTKLGTLSEYIRYRLYSIGFGLPIEPLADFTW